MGTCLVAGLVVKEIEMEKKLCTELVSWGSWASRENRETREKANSEVDGFLGASRLDLLQSCLSGVCKENLTAL